MLGPWVWIEGGGTDLQLLLVLGVSPLWVLIVTAATLVEGAASRLPPDRTLRRALAVLLIGCLEGLLVPGLGLQAIYLEGVLTAGNLQGMREVERALANALQSRDTLLGFMFPALIAMACAFPRVRGSLNPTAEVVGAGTLIALPVLVVQPCIYLLVLIAFGLLSATISGVDGLVIWATGRPSRQAVADLRQRVRAGTLRPRHLNLAAALGHRDAIVARGQIYGPGAQTPGALVAAVQVFGEEATGLAVLLLAHLTIPSHPDPQRARRALDVAAAQIRDPSAENLAAVQALANDWRWPTGPASPADRGLHCALEAASLMGRVGNARPLRRSIQSALIEALEVVPAWQVSQTLQTRLVAWALDGEDPLSGEGPPPGPPRDPGEGVREAPSEA